MQPIYEKIRTLARQIAETFPVPDFYTDHVEANTLSRHLLDQNPEIPRLEKIVGSHLKDNFGHGFKHSRKVTCDAGALMVIESRNAGHAEKAVHRKVMLAHMAGMLHDVKRNKKDHAVEGAAFSREVLRDFPLSVQEQEDICTAIRNHEAFKKGIPIKSTDGVLVDGCLYDADKFRWGPDNFTDTVWDMISFHNPPLSEFIKHYPRGMQGIEKIKKTFRTATGKMYGPQFIDLGLAIGNKLYDTILTEFESTLG
ncbi:MAG: HD domain-containing protein [Thermodesulfobacteriota bacterium]